MKENEAKSCIQGKLDCMNKCDVFDCKGTDECDGCNYCYSQGNFGEQKEAFEVAIQSLEEIQQYRAMEQKLQSVYGEHDGLLEIVVNGLVRYENAPDKAIKAVLLTDDDVDRWEAYKAIGTVEECKADKVLADKMYKYFMDDAELLKEYKAIGTIEDFKQAMNFKKYFMELYDEGLEVANWHKNGDLEPLVNFIDEACN